MKENEMQAQLAAAQAQAEEWRKQAEEMKSRCDAMMRRYSHITPEVMCVIEAKTILEKFRNDLFDKMTEYFGGDSDMTYNTHVSGKVYDALATIEDYLDGYMLDDLRNGMYEKVTTQKV